MSTTSSAQRCRVVRAPRSLRGVRIADRRRPFEGVILATRGARAGASPQTPQCLTVRSGYRLQPPAIDWPNEPGGIKAAVSNQLLYKISVWNRVGLMRVSEGLDRELAALAQQDAALRL